MVQLLFILVLISVEMRKKREQKLTTKNLNVDRQFFKGIIRIFFMLLCLIPLQGVGLIPIFKKICNPFALFPSIKTPSQMIKWKFLYVPLTPFCYNPPFCPTNPLLINHMLIWKSKVKHTSVDITCF